jgi:DnaK suppressor protein
VITLPRYAMLSAVRADLEAKLEQEYEGCTERLAALLEPRRRPGRDREQVTTQTRQALADVAQALRRMAEGSYGTCERCAGDIEIDHLEASPSARYCRACAPCSAA